MTLYTVYQVICGSRLYGLNTPNSDTDYGSVFLESKEQIYGIDVARPLPQIVTEERDDNRHWLRSFASLCKRGNPNAMEWLWAPVEAVLHVDPLFKKWILNNAYSFLGLESLTASHFGFATSQIGKMRPANFAEDNISARMRSKSGKVGAERREIVKKYGYDTKYASHAARLMLQLQMLVTTGQVVYPFTGDAYRQVMAIKTGEVANSDIDKILDDIKASCDAAVKTNIANIPPHPNADKINEALVNFYQEAFV